MTASPSGADATTSPAGIAGAGALDRPVRVGPPPRSTPRLRPRRPPPAAGGDRADRTAAAVRRRGAPGCARGRRRTTGSFDVGAAADPGGTGAAISLSPGAVAPVTMGMASRCPVPRLAPHSTVPPHREATSDPPADRPGARSPRLAEGRLRDHGFRGHPVQEDRAGGPVLRAEGRAADR